MNFKNVMVVNAIMAIYFGFGSLLFSTMFWGMYGLDVPGEGIWALRIIGILVVSNLFIVWQSRKLADPDGRRLVADFVSIVWGLYFIIALWGQIVGVFNALNWTNVIGAIFFAVLTFLVRNK